MRQGSGRVWPDPWPNEPMEWLRATGAALADLALGRCCAGCDRPGTHLCHDCADQLRPAVRLHTMLRLDDVAPGLTVPVLTPLDYAGVCRKALYRFKDHRDLSVTRLLVSALSAALDAAESCSEVAAHLVVPIPSRRSAIRRRGFNPIEHVVTRSIAGRGIVIERLLRDSRTSPADKALGGADRHAAVAGAFDVCGPITRWPVIVVDDVVTTGATLREAAATLMHAGVQVVAAAAIAGTPSVGVRR